MLKNKKYVTKIRNVIIVLMAIIVIIGFYIKVRHTQVEVIQTNAIAADELMNMKEALRIAAIEIDKRNN